VTRHSASWLLPLLLAGCPATPSDPPPPAAKLEIPMAPPRARGALAGGTDAAPKPDGLPEAEGELAAPAPPPAGSAPDAGAPAPAPEPEPAPPAAAPDAGMAL
jgi:hypothetical protein